MADDLKDIEAIWDKLSKIFNNWAGIRPRKSWFTTGYSERAGYKRLRILENGREAVKFYDITKDLNMRELRYLLKRAELNFEQAYSAGRINNVISGTAVIGMVVLFNQIFPGTIAKHLFEPLMSNLHRPAAIFVILCYLSALLFFIGNLSYSFGGTAQARDLKHLLELSLARRDFHDGKRNSEDTDKENILKDSYLTNI